MGIGKRHEASQGGWVGIKRSFLASRNYAMTPFDVFLIFVQNFAI